MNTLMELRSPPLVLSLSLSLSPSLSLPLLAIHMYVCHPLCSFQPLCLSHHCFPRPSHSLSPPRGRTRSNLLSQLNIANLLLLLLLLRPTFIRCLSITLLLLLLLLLPPPPPHRHRPPTYRTSPPHPKKAHELIPPLDAPNETYENCHQLPHEDRALER